MLVQVIGDNHIHGKEALAGHVQGTVEAALDRFGQQITRVEVHLADENGHKSGKSEKRCSLQARVAGLQAVGASASGGSVDQA